MVAYYVLRKKDLDHAGQKQLSRRKTFLILLYTSLASLDLLTASANTKAVNLASNIGALAVFILNGKVCFPIGLPAALFCIAGHYLGAGMVVKNGTRVVRPVILLVLTVLFVKVFTGE